MPGALGWSHPAVGIQGRKEETIWELRTPGEELRAVPEGQSQLRSGD